MSSPHISKKFIVFVGALASLLGMNPAESAESTSIAHGNDFIVKQVDELSGFMCEPYRFETRRDAKQTLGFVNKKNTTAGANVSSNRHHRAEYFDPYGDRNKKRHKSAAKAKSKQRSFAGRKHIEQPSAVETVRANKVDSVREDKLATVSGDVKSAVAAKSAPVAPKPAPTPTLASRVEAKKAANPDARQEPRRQEAPKQLVEAPKSAPATQANAVTENTPSATLDRYEIRFASEATALTDENKKVLGKVAERALKDNNLFVKIKSYTPNKAGRVSEMKRKSLQRAIKARKQLIEAGVSPVRISVNSVGSTDATTGRLELLLENSG